MKLSENIHVENDSIRFKLPVETPKRLPKGL